MRGHGTILVALDIGMHVKHVGHNLLDSWHTLLHHLHVQILLLHGFEVRCVVRSGVW
jgi:hypothetical protein